MIGRPYGARGPKELSGGSHVSYCWQPSANRIGARPCYFFFIRHAVVDEIGILFRLKRRKKNVGFIGPRFEFRLLLRVSVLCVFLTAKSRVSTFLSPATFYTYKAAHLIYRHWIEFPKRRNKRNKFLKREKKIDCPARRIWCHRRWNFPIKRKRQVK